ncbi:MAG: hypothetical protein ACYTG0_34735 [Planctomycetota bacterium]|jgi:hypothetical protein
MRWEIGMPTLVVLIAFCLAGVVAEPTDAPQETTKRTATREVLFHIGGQDLFDKTLSFKREGEKDGARRVIVDLVDGETFCPIEMGRWIAGYREATSALDQLTRLFPKYRGLFQELKDHLEAFQFAAERDATMAGQIVQRMHEFPDAIPLIFIGDFHTGPALDGSGAGVGHRRQSLLRGQYPVRLPLGGRREEYRSH